MTLHLLGLALNRVDDPGQAPELPSEAIGLFDNVGDHEQAIAVRAAIT